MSERRRKLKRSMKRSSTENPELFGIIAASAPKREYRGDVTERGEVEGSSEASAGTSKDKPEVPESEAVINCADSDNANNSESTDDGTKIKYISPSKIRFTQESIADKFGDGRTLEGTLQELKTGKITVESIPNIKVIPVKENDAYFSHDNRRLCVFQKYEAHLGKEIQIPCVIGEPEDLPRKRITATRRSLGKDVKIVKENFKSKDKKSKNHAKLVEEWGPKKIPKAEF